MPPSPPGPDASRLRPFRVAAYVVYLAAVGIISGLVIVSVTGSVAAMTPSLRPDSDEVLTVRECLDLAELQWRELERQRLALTDRSPARKADEDWVQFRVGWLERLRDTQATCALRAQARRPLARVFDRLERVMDLYTIHATQYAGEIGPTVDALRAARVQAEQALRGGGSSAR